LPLTYGQCPIAYRENDRVLSCLYPLIGNYPFADPDQPGVMHDSRVRIMGLCSVRAVKMVAEDDGDPTS
jgi:hypothetical protein